MFEKIRECLNEVIDIANKCPEKYQIKCFEILLDAVVKGEAAATQAIVGLPAAAVQVPEKPKFDFFSQHGISDDEWSRVFHFDGSSYSIIVKSLGEKRTSKKQIKLALLLGTTKLLNTREATILKDELMELCKTYSAYDQANFAAHMKNQKDLFLAKGNDWILTVPGRDKAAEVIKELAQ